MSLIDLTANNLVPVFLKWTYFSDITDLVFCYMLEYLLWHFPASCFPHISIWVSLSGYESFIVGHWKNILSAQWHFQNYCTLCMLTTFTQPLDYRNVTKLLHWPNKRLVWRCSFLVIVLPPSKLASHHSFHPSRVAALHDWPHFSHRCWAWNGRKTNQ